MNGMKISGFVKSKDKDGSHKPEAMGEATVIANVGDNDYIVETETGTRCHALFNFFCGTWFIDDVYSVEKGTGERDE